MHPKIERLYELRMLTDEAQCPEFSQLCEELSTEHDGALLPDLFRVFTDRTEHHEVMADLQGLVEHFPRQTYIAGLSAALPGMLDDARSWAKALLRAVLHTPADTALLRIERAKASQADRDATVPLFREIAARVPKLAS